ERLLHRGCADGYSPVLRRVGVGDGNYAFYVLLDETLSPPARDSVFVRPVGSSHRLELAPELRTLFEPISHLAMDIVNNCNIRCPFCVYDYANTRTTRFMSDETFESALRLIPYVTDGNFWLSCLHEATMHPRLTDFIARVPDEHRIKLFYTTNLAKRMPDAYFAFLAGSGMHHLNISVESLDPAIYEMMRKGARYRIFLENWAKLLDAFAGASAPPRLRYNVMAYRSNLREIPELIDVLRREKMAWQVEVRHTFEEPHIPAEFREREFLSTADWAWLAGQLARYSPNEVLLLLPPGGVGYDRPNESFAPVAPLSGPSLSPAPPTDATEVGRAPSGYAYELIPKPLHLSMDWDGTLRVYGEQPRGANQPPTHVNYVMTNINYLKDPLRFLLTL
ncbi:MAG TPA: radical SAM protein, partial [Acetobacteraceae bacterium]|nr:radical SAM protein [Acetobacteraceae bacterium]